VKGLKEDIYPVMNTKMLNDDDDDNDEYLDIRERAIEK